MRSPKWAVKDSNLRRHTPADLQSAPFGHLGNRPDTFPSPGFWRTAQEPTTGVEPVTYRLQGGCSAVELRRPYDKNAPTVALGDYTKTATAESISNRRERQSLPLLLLRLGSGSSRSDWGNPPPEAPEKRARRQTS